VYSALALAGVLYASGCGGGGSHAAATTATTAGATTLHDALVAPDATILRPGQKAEVSRKALHSIGWQVACVDGDRRVTAEAVRGQRTGSGRVISYAGGSPSIWVEHDPDGSITIRCR
jgi:hypothetical protein